MLQERLVETQVCWALDETRERERVYPTFSLSSFDILRASVATCCKCSPQAFPRVAAYTPHRWSCPWQPLSQRWELDVWGMMSLMPDMGQNRATNKEIGQPFKHDVFGLWLYYSQCADSFLLLYTAPLFHNGPLYLFMVMFFIDFLWFPDQPMRLRPRSAGVFPALRCCCCLYGLLHGVTVDPLG